jgi:hypothetical protein
LATFGRILAGKNQILTLFALEVGATRRKTPRRSVGFLLEIGQFGVLKNAATIDRFPCYDKR